MIYHDERGFWSDYEYYPGGFCLWNINYRHLDISTDERIREAENPANDASPPTHGRRPLFLGEPIQTWVPGYEITMLLWFPKEDGKFDVSAEGIPAKTTIKISYSDIFELNAVLLFGTTKPKTPVQRIQTDLQNIHQELKSLREGCGFPEANPSNPH